MALWTLGVRQWHSTSYMKMHDSSIMGFVLLVLLGLLVLLIGKRTELVSGDFIGGDRTQIWGFRPPDPALRGGTPRLKLPCVWMACVLAWSGIHYILDFSRI